jgi:outer membrane protein OmpA-like peptidoglycan-associated protein
VVFGNGAPKCKLDTIAPPPFGAEELPLPFKVSQSDDRLCIDVPADLLFDFNKDVLKDKALEQLKQWGLFVKANQDRRVLIEGHTDSIGTDEFNQGLSERRADAVARWLIEKGYATRQRIVIYGRGKTRPVALNSFIYDLPEGRALNRRVQMCLLKW